MSVSVCVCVDAAIFSGSDTPGTGPGTAADKGTVADSSDGSHSAGSGRRWQKQQQQQLVNHSHPIHSRTQQLQQTESQRRHHPQAHQLRGSLSARSRLGSTGGCVQDEQNDEDDTPPLSPGQYMFITASV